MCRHRAAAGAGGAVLTDEGKLDELRLFDPGKPVSLTLRDRFLVPPFSILDTKAGYWRDRKRQWLALGIRSELGRDEALLGYESLNTPDFNDGQFASFHTTSVFDPVLCELLYRWYVPSGGTVLDPFAGGSVRGLVAGRMGRRYIGIDLRDEQVQANREQADAFDLDDGPTPTWVTGDSQEVLRQEVERMLAEAVRDGLPACGTCDFLFSCPPYYDLEQYSDDPRDLSNASTYAEFLEAYCAIVGHGCALLRDNRFAAMVVADVRQGQHGYLDAPLVRDTIAAFEDAGLHYYGEYILATSVGSLAVRITRQFGAARKPGKMHQQVLLFVKGDPRVATEALPKPPELEIETEGGHWQADGTAVLGEERAALGADSG